ncbi:ABC transporter permease [Bifidobacterium apri]|uniref:ABC transporter permease n=1 Tax=Bifidobacterium apri TaxID=1769423 RepID=UPI0039940BE9
MTAPERVPDIGTPSGVTAGTAKAGRIDNTGRMGKTDESGESGESGGIPGASNTTVTLIRLRWTLTFASLKHAPQRVIATVASLIFAVCLVAAAVITAIRFGGNAMPAGTHAGDLLNTSVVLGGAVAMLGVLLFQLMYVGQASAMDPQKFKLFGIDDGALTRGLFIAGMCGSPAICGMLALFAFAPIYRGTSAAMTVVAAVSAPVTVAVLLAMSKALISLFTLLADSRRARGWLYIVSMPLCFFVLQLPNMLISSGVKEVTYAKYAAVAAWTPFGAAFQLPFDAGRGRWELLVARLAIIAVTCLLCYRACLWCLRRERRVGGRGGAAQMRRGIGIFARVPDSVSGAISARLATYLRRDPRQLVMYAAPVLVLVAMLLQPEGVRNVVWCAPLMGGLMLAAIEGNGVAYDGLGFTLEVLSGVRGIDDRRGRVRVHVVIMLAYLTLLSAVCMVMTGTWRHETSLGMSVMVWALSVGLGLCAIGVAEVISPVFMYPIAPADRPFSTPQGHAASQVLIPLMHVFVSMMALLPTVLIAIAIVVTGVEGFGLLLGVVLAALLNGVGVLVLGMWLGGIVLGERQLTVLVHLRDFASLQ